MCQNCKRTSIRSRFFANFMAKENEASYLQYRDKKEELFKNIQGRVLEIGPGTGVNLRFLSKKAKWIGLEPNNAMHQHISNEAKDLGIQIEIIEGLAESSKLRSDSMDYVISTMVLCSVKSVTDTLNEIKRVLKPGGRFLFLEHQADKKWTTRWVVQKIVPFTPWRYFSDGCTPSRKIGKAIEKAGFDEVQYKEYLQEGNGLILAINKPHIYGWAQK